MKINVLFVSFLLYAQIFTGQKVDMASFHGMSPRNIGPAGMSGRVTSIDVVLENPDIIYLGTAAGGVFRSENAGHTWTGVFENEKTASVGAVSVYQKNPDIIYVGTGEGNPRNSQNSGNGMYKSIDCGRTWMHLGLDQSRQIHRVIIHPDDPDNVTVGVSGATWGESPERGVYKTYDGGKSWKKVLYIDAITGCSDLVQDPYNPNKMIAAMWTHQRWPWFFKSGGEGSGIFITYDGGETWQRTVDKSGLPKGPLGRIGLSIARSQPEIVYAFIESENNGIYRSEDGGHTWKRVSKPKEKIGDRPFYYADVYVDPLNENRIYSIATEINISEDAGKTWTVFAPGNKIHTDHHAFWVHPKNSSFIMAGHDGGFNITHDRGKNWWFADNLPLAQFYHIRADNEIPYNVYGGLQDNGSWKGPSEVRFKGGIRNFYWQRLSVGDGFDVVPDPKDSNKGYAMGQAGNLVRYDTKSGQLLSIKPQHPEGEYLRFNWNAGIAINPHDNKTIYYGSQYVHKSSDHGQSWEIISPDLTTNNPDKQKFLESGGLTYDVTGAEFHTTIITIAPSSVDADVLWVGTDDGQVQLTLDGGQTWDNLTSHMRGVPQGIWVPQIQASVHQAGEAFVVFDDHRRNNWTPFVYRTRDFGQTWTRVVGQGDVGSYVYCFEQDPVEENLYFCGADDGFYVSFDAGQNWNKWTNDFPTTPVSDMVVHPRDHDLVIGTFGRAIWILDDIRPLREMASRGYRNISTENLYVFPCPPACARVIGESIGYRQGKVGDAYFNGENRPYGVMITYHLGQERDSLSGGLKDSVRINIYDDQDILTRQLVHSPKPGVNRLSWDLRRDRERSPNAKKPGKDKLPGGGIMVAPGRYRIEVSYNDQSLSTFAEVLKDPLLDMTDDDIEEKERVIKKYYSHIRHATEVMDAIRTNKEAMEFYRKRFKEEEKDTPPGIDSLFTAVEAGMKTIEEAIVGKDVQGIYRQPETVMRQMSNVGSLIGDPQEAMSPNQANALDHFVEAVSKVVDAYERLKSGDLAVLEKAIKEAGMPVFK